MSNSVYLPISYRHRNLAIPNELIVNEEKGSLYIKLNNKVPELGFDRIDTIKEIEFDNIIGNMAILNNDMKSISDILKAAHQWKDKVTVSDPSSEYVTTLEDIYSKLNGIEKTDLKTLFDSKQTKVPGMIISDNNFTDILRDKLDLIEWRANKYIHPTKKQCDYIPTVISVNGKTGNVILNTTDIGLSELDPNANFYEHPTDKLCNTKLVESVNSKTGIVVLNKKDIGLEYVENYKTSTDVDVVNNNPNVYLTPKTLKLLLSKYTTTQFTNVKVSEDGILYGIKLSGYKVNGINSYTVEYNGKSITITALALFIKNKDNVIVVQSSKVYTQILDLNTMTFNTEKSVSYVGNFRNISKVTGVSNVKYIISTDTSKFNIGTDVNGILTNTTSTDNKKYNTSLAHYHDNTLVGINNNNIVITSDINMSNVIERYTSPVLSITLGNSFILVLTATRTLDLVSLGYIPSKVSSDKPEDTDFIKISSGNNHCIALKSDGTFKIWGLGQTVTSMKKYENLGNIIDVYAIGDKTVILNNKYNCLTF